MKMIEFGKKCQDCGKQLTKTKVGWR